MEESMITQVIFALGAISFLWMGITSVVGAFRYQYPQLVIMGVGNILLGMSFGIDVVLYRDTLLFRFVLSVLGVICIIWFEFFVKGRQALVKRGVTIDRVFMPFGKLK
jgi:hypothetical protein